MLIITLVPNLLFIRWIDVKYHFLHTRLFVQWSINDEVPKMAEFPQRMNVIKMQR